jgi:type III pantothenate kinase
LLVDIGNTNISLGLGQGTRTRMHDHMPTAGTRVADIRRILETLPGITGAVISSVVPAATRRWERAIRSVCDLRPLIVHHRLQLGVALDFAKPGSIGGDRLANAAGAVARYGAPVIVADFGTAVTFDVITRNRAYVGGVIAPGLSVMTDYLNEKTALLPRIKLKGSFGAVGKSTITAMRIGAKIGYRGMVREIVTYLTYSLNMKRVKLVATGGHARWVLEDLDMPFAFDPNLTLHGMQRIYELNRETHHDG